MERIEKYNLPEHTNRLYKEEASSSIGLVREVADKINELVDAYNEAFATDLKWKQTQEGIIRKGVIYMKDNLINTLRELLKSYDYETIKSYIIEAYGEEIELLRVFTTPQMYGAKGNGVQDDTSAIQMAIDEANKKSRVIYLPRGIYKISKSLVLNGCSIIGEAGNVFQESGTVIQCVTSDFTAIKQGSVQTKDIMFNISDVIVKNAGVGFELNYVINSKFERLYCLGCGTGFKLGSPDTVGSMFCEFNNLYTKNCVKGVIVDSMEFFNNNRFNNGYLEASELAMSMKVTGGYGAVDNVFNNVEFRSSKGRGIELSNCLNTIFNTCYFECGGNALRTNTYSTVTMNNCIYGSFDPTNTNTDENIVYSVGGSAFTFEGGTIFLNANYIGVAFFGTGNNAVYQNITVTKNIVKNGSATSFVFFPLAVREVAYKVEEQVVTTSTITLQAGESMEVPFTYPTPFSSIPNVVLYTMRGSSGLGMNVIVSDRLKDGGKLKVSNTGSTANSVSFMIYAKIL